MENPKGSSEHPTCSRELTEGSEETENAFVPKKCSDPSEQATDKLTCLEEPTEPVILSSESETRSPEPPKCEKAKDDGAELVLKFVSDKFLNLFVEQLSRVPPLWRPGMHKCRASHIKTKTARGFAYIRLLSALEPEAGGDSRAQIERSQLLCRLFFKKLKYYLRREASNALAENPEVSADEALRSCPVWVQRADAFLNQMPLMLAHLNAQKNGGDKKIKKSQPYSSEPLARSSLLQDVRCAGGAGGAAGAALLRRVVRGVRRAARRAGALTRAAAARVAARLGEKEDRIYALWCGMRKLSLYKLRASIARGDAPSDTGRLDALDWAVVDVFLMYNGEILNESQYQNYEQLSALLGTFHLVQRFDLERYQQKVAPQEWVDAARWYSRNRVQMSALALFKRWHELKADTRARFLAQSRAPSPAARLPLPLHQAIARRYGHVVTQKHPRNWRYIVAEGLVPPPTSERGPAPGEDPVRRDIGDDDSSDPDTAPADDDDIAIVEKSLVTIDLSDDDKNEDKTETEGHTTGVPKDQMVPNTVVPEITANTYEKDTLQKQKTNENIKNPSETSSEDTSKVQEIEIVDLDAPSPKTDVLEAFKELDASNIETTIIFDSDDEEDNIISDVNNKDSNVPVDANKDNVPSTNVTDDTESQANIAKARKRHRRLTSDSSDGNLVIDCGDVNSENESDSDSDNTSTQNDSRQSANYIADSKAIEKETWPNVGNNSKSNDVKEASNDSETTESITEYPELIKILTTKSTEKSMKVYYNRNKKVDPDRINSNAKAVPVGDLISEASGENREEESSSEDDSPSSYEEEAQENESGVIDPKLLMYAVVLLERIPEPMLSLSTPSLPQPYSSSPSPSPRDSHSPSPSDSHSPSPSPRVSPSPTPRVSPSPSPFIKSEPPHSPPISTSSETVPTPTPPLSLRFGISLCPEIVLNRKNWPLIKMCKLCSVGIQRMDLSEKGRAGSRVAKKVELPDIEEVRRANRSMLTAQVAPRRARRTSGSSISPSSASDSDWAPDRAAAGSDSGGERARRSAPVHAAELGRLLDTLADADDDNDCGHSKSTGMRGPAGAVYAPECPRCAARVLAAPPASGHEARLQRRLLRRAVRMARGPHQQPSTASPSSSTTVPVPATTSTTTTTAPTTTTTATPTVVMTKAPERRERPRNRKRVRPPPATPSPPPPPAPRVPPRPLSPLDAEAAAREWLRQKNIAAEKFGVKPRSFKKIPPPVVESAPPATIQPIEATITPTDQAPKPPEKQNEFSIVISNHTGATVMALTQENLAKHSPAPSFRGTASSSTAPTFFNPHAVATINKKLGSLEPSPLGFTPVITNIQSLSNLKPVKCTMKKGGDMTKKIIFIPAAKNQSPKEDESRLPQVVNVAGNVKLLPSGVGQGLHLVVSREKPPQQPVVVSEHMIQSQTTSCTKSNAPKYVLSMGQSRPPLILNSVLAGTQPGLVLSADSTSHTVVISSSPRTSAVEASSLYTSVPGRTPHSAPMLVRSVQAGPPGPPAQPPILRIMASRLAPGPAETPKTTAIPGTSKPPLTYMISETSTQVTPSIPGTSKIVTSEEMSEDDSDVNMSLRLEAHPALSSRVWARGHDSTALCVLCTGPRRAPGWLIRPMPDESYLVVSEAQPPPRVALYWSLKPRVRLILPDEDYGQPVEKRPKMSTPDSTQENSADSTPKPGYLKVRAFARLAPEVEKEPEKEPEKFQAPPRVQVQETIYQKMSDDQLIYAKLVVAVPSPAAFRALLVRGAPIELYCLRTGKLYPLEAERKQDVSRIKLSGDERISGALVEIAKRLFRDSAPGPGMETGAEQVQPVGARGSSEHVGNLCAEEFSDSHSKQAGQVQQHVQHAGEQGIQQGEAAGPGGAQTLLVNMLSGQTFTIQPGSAASLPLTCSEVIDLSDDD